MSCHNSGPDISILERGNDGISASVGDTHLQHGQEGATLCHGARAGTGHEQASRFHNAHGCRIQALVLSPCSLERLPVGRQLGRVEDHNVPRLCMQRMSRSNACMLPQYDC